MYSSPEQSALSCIYDVQEFWEQLEHVQAAGSHQPSRCKGEDHPLTEPDS